MKAILITGDEEETRIVDVRRGATTLYTPKPLAMNIRNFTGTNSTVAKKIFPTQRYELILKRPNGDLVYRRVR